MSPSLTICGLGPGGPEHLTAGTRSALEGEGRRFLRTSRHPTAHLAATEESFDHLYEAAETFDQVYLGIVEALLEAAIAGPVTYIVPGSPLVLERSVRRLLDDDRIEVEVVPGLSFLDVAWARLGVDPVEEGVRLLDGHRFAVEAAGERGPLLVAHVHAPWVLSDIKLALDADDEQRVVVLQRLGTPDESIIEIGANELDRVVEPDHLTSLYLPEVAAPVARELARTVDLMHRLRQECPWDQKQTHQSLRPYLLEESYEVLEAIDALPAPMTPEEPSTPQGEAPGLLTATLAVDDEAMTAYAELEEELGDVWFQLLFHAELAAEAGHFTIADVARSLHEKLVRRHPHVFGDVEVSGTDDIVANWDRIKKTEKQRSGALDGIPTALPALSLAAKVLSRAGRSGSPADTSGLTPDGFVLPDDIDEAALGQLLLAVVANAAAQNLDAEDALRAAVLRARDRFESEEASGRISAQWIQG